MEDDARMKSVEERCKKLEAQFLQFAVDSKQRESATLLRWNELMRRNEEDRCRLEERQKETDQRLENLHLFTSQRFDAMSAMIRNATRDRDSDSPTRDTHVRSPILNPPMETDLEACSSFRSQLLSANSHISKLCDGVSDGASVIQERHPLIAREETMKVGHVDEASSIVQALLSVEGDIETQVHKAFSSDVEENNSELKEGTCTHSQFAHIGSDFRTINDRWGIENLDGSPLIVVNDDVVATQIAFLVMNNQLVIAQELFEKRLAMILIDFCAFVELLSSIKHSFGSVARAATFVFDPGTSKVRPWPMHDKDALHLFVEMPKRILDSSSLSQVIPGPLIAFSVIASVNVGGVVDDSLESIEIWLRNSGSKLMEILANSAAKKLLVEGLDRMILWAAFLNIPKKICLNILEVSWPYDKGKCNFLFADEDAVEFGELLDLLDDSIWIFDPGIAATLMLKFILTLLLQFVPDCS